MFLLIPQVLLTMAPRNSTACNAVARKTGTPSSPLITQPRSAVQRYAVPYRAVLYIPHRIKRACTYTSYVYTVRACGVGVVLLELGALGIFKSPVCTYAFGPSSSAAVVYVPPILTCARAQRAEPPATRSALYICCLPYFAGIFVPTVYAYPYDAVLRGTIGYGTYGKYKKNYLVRIYLPTFTNNI